MPRTISSLIHNALLLKQKYFPKFNTLKPQLIRSSSRSPGNYTKMGSLISTSSSSSKGNTNARITDSSIWSPQLGQHISIRTFRELSRAPTSSLTSTRTETQLNGDSSRSTAGLLEEVSSLLTTHMPRR
ncbi:AC4 [Passionfruit leaf distortion virus]|uniref:AC4 n=1 Tax=Passionfruit leaf distortion virus TaxID=1737555 RepID=A0A1D6XWJ4_9GEMI|nr:AC4 [Passionfruit leaf distortion virus]ALL25617.1 AC4 [Passionfruit leaf distortion virus]